VPFPLPEEMTLDEKGNELTADKLHEKFMEFNVGKQDILTFDPDGEKFGAVILAAGWRPYEPQEGEFAHLGFGELPDVVTNYQFEEMAAAGDIICPSDGREAKSVVFIQSPGQGNDKDFAYAGAVTSLVTLKQAKYVREDHADGKAYVFYQHMRTVGLTENFYKNIQQDPGIFLTKGEVTAVSKTAAA
jgi:quinone-modifying oxidoreductase subunit QmoB